MSDKTDNTILGMAAANMAIVYYEHRGALGWLPYLGILGMLVVALIFRPLAYALFIPITGINLLINTKRIRGLKEDGYHGGS